MAKNEKQMTRKPATKFPSLRKKLAKGKTQAKLLRTKQGFASVQ
jgi:hypothetical protein